ncbi:MAG: Diacylglycerol O-acyltransferase [Polaromonas sp.]|jgi:diacylglycerol O-acyltransferase|nr:Diacylglycerol O-acyltransferase [Polaromonas sp.]MDB5846237.1 Diacylglycerol O-acyltransferase [Polaromonas sp.]
MPDERMSKVDTAWLRMDNPGNLMQITGVWLLAPGVKYAAVCERIENTLVRYDRFRQCAVQDATGASWVADRHFDLARHVVREKLPASASAAGGQEQALQERVAELASQPLDRARPLWQFHLIENYLSPEGVRGSAMILRIHHCIADGIALLGVIMAMADGGAPPPVPGEPGAAASAPQNAQDVQAWMVGSVLAPLTQLAVRALDALGDGAARSLGRLNQPGGGLGLERGVEAGVNGVKGSLDMARLLLQVAGDSAALALMPDDSPTRLKGKSCGRKQVAWCQPVPLAEVKAVGKALGCSLNDVLLSCLAGALGGYLKSQGDDIAGQDIRAMVPVNLRQPEASPTLGNHFGLAPLLLPIGIDNPVERVCEVRRRMAALKGSYQPLLAFGLLAVAGLCPKPAQDAMLDIFSRKTTAVMTNVPGPRDKLHFCGATLEQTMFWVPQSGDVGLGVSILSYGGGVQFGVITDSALCPEPQRIVDEFMPEFARLSMVTLMLPWDDA